MTSILVWGQTFSAVSADNANNYGSAWAGNGGINFDAWVFQNIADGGFAGEFLENNTNSYSPSIYTNNKSFGTFANNGTFPRITAFRGLGENLRPGDVFVVEIQHGGISSSGSMGFTLRSGNTSSNADDYNTDSRFEVAFIGGSSSYSIFANATTDSGVPFTNGGLRVKVTLLDLNTVDVELTELDGNSVTTIQNIALGGSQNSEIESFALFNRNVRDANVYFNNLTIERPTFATIADGDFSTGTTWEGGNAPSSVGIININHNVILTSYTFDGDLNIAAGKSLTANDLTNNGTITLNSTSTEYSSLIANSGTNTNTGTINYKRFVNVIGSGASGIGGNDLIAAPVGTAASSSFVFQDLLNDGNPINSDVIARFGNIFAFAPYNNSLIAYENYSTTNAPPNPSSTQTIVAGKGYRVATISGANVTFTGPFSSDAVSIGISSPEAGSQWNLIGNPYPSYLDAKKFLQVNSNVLDNNAVAIYAYNGNTYNGGAPTSGNFTIINEATIDMYLDENFNIAPGQGFFVAATDLPDFLGNVQFNTGPLPADDMRTTSGAGDYIQGRSSTPNYMLNLNLEHSYTSRTNFFFTANASRGLDPGYDAAAYGTNANNTPIYSHLVEDNTGRAMAMQSLGEQDFYDIVIPLGVNNSQGTQITFSIGETTLPTTVKVYLEDQVANTVTLLNASDYVLTPTTNLVGTGRFFLRFTDNALSTVDNTLDTLSIYTNNTEKTIVMAGQLLESTTANVYDLQGRLVATRQLETSKTRQSIAVSNLSSGVYVVQLSDVKQSKSLKVIIQ